MSGKALRGRVGVVSVPCLLGACGGETTEPEVTLSSIVVQPAGDTLTALGDTLQLSATARDARGRILSPKLSWLSSDPTTVAIDTAGRAVAVSEGVAEVTVYAGSVADTATLTVAQEVASVTVAPDSLTLTPGDTARITVAAEDRRGNPINGRTVTWTTFDSTVASVGPSGLVRAVGTRLGPMTLEAAVGGRSATAAVEVVVTFRAIAVGDGFSCALTVEDGPYCWGDNSEGQLGSGSGPGGPRPVSLVGDIDFDVLTAGATSACGITATKEAYCWGDGPIGDGTFGATEPSPVLGGHEFETIALGLNHGCGATPTGSAYCWGINTNGELGDSSAVSSASPVAVVGGHVFELGAQPTVGVQTVSGSWVMDETRSTNSFWSWAVDHSYQSPRGCVAP